jgi:hypothetical protein
MHASILLLFILTGRDLGWSKKSLASSGLIVTQTCTGSHDQARLPQPQDPASNIDTLQETNNVQICDTTTKCRRRRCRNRRELFYSLTALRIVRCPGMMQNVERPVTRLKVPWRLHLNAQTRRQRSSPRGVHMIWDLEYQDMTCAAALQGMRPSNSLSSKTIRVARERNPTMRRQVLI